MKRLNEKECLELKTEVRSASDKIIDDIVNEFQEDIVRMKSDGERAVAYVEKRRERDPYDSLGS